MNHFAKRISISEKIPVVQLTLTGEYINTFPSIYNAARETNIHTGCIYESIKCWGATAKGFKFVALDKYDSNKTYNTLAIKRLKRKIKAGKYTCKTQQLSK